jgi:hypothetical protein
LNFGKYASIIPLAFDMGNGQSRAEDFICYANGDWEDLPSLFEAPLEYLRGQQFVWTQQPGVSVPWQLLSPLSATVECGYSSVENFCRGISYVGGPLSTYLESINLELAKPNSFTQPQLDAIIEFMAGTFFVEFNTYTSSIRVLYFPPNLRYVQERRALYGPRYTGGFSGPSLYSAATPFFDVTALHFDLAESSSRMRADFLTALFEDPQDIMDAVAATVPFVTNTYAMVEAKRPKSQLVLPDPANQLPLPPGYTITTLPFGSPTLGSPLVQPGFFEGFAIYPTVQVNNLSDATIKPVCQVCNAIVDGANGVIHVGLILSEAYSRILYDPAAVIEQVLATQPLPPG